MLDGRRGIRGIRLMSDNLLTADEAKDACHLVENPMRAEIDIIGDDVTINSVILNTGEVRQKRRSLEWLVNRILRDEFKTWSRVYGEEFTVIDTVVRSEE